MNEELKIIIRAELEQFKKAMKDAVAGIKGVANESRKASKEIDGFTAEVNQQGKALSDLKQKYIDLAKAHGTESKEAKDAAEAIRKLSAEYKTNKALAGDLANKANSFDVSLGSDNANKNVEKTNESMDELKETMSGILGLNIFEFLGKSVDKYNEKIKSNLKLSKEYFKDAKKSFSNLGYNIKQMFGSFSKKFWSSEYGQDNVSGQMMIEGFAESSKLAITDVQDAAIQASRGIGAAFKAIGAGIMASAAVIIADLLVIIGLAKNALSMAKQIKAMSNEASRAGMTTATFQEWGYVLKQVGIEEDKLTDFTKKLAERQNELRSGSEEVAKAFEEIGLSQEEVLGSSQEELFRKSVAGLQNIENEAERTSVAFRIFSDDATDLANVLYLTNQETQSLVDNYYNLGGAPSDNLINKSKILSGSTTNLSYAWQGLKNTLAEWVIPAVIAVVQWLTTAVAYINAFLQGIFGIKNVGKDASKGTENVGKGIGKIGNSAKKATGAVKELLRYTMGFDELNIIPKQSTGSGSSGGDAANNYGGYSGANINPDIPVIETPDLSKFRAWMDEYGGIIQGILTWTLLLGGVAMVVAGFMTGNIPLIVGGFSVAGLGIAIGAAGGEESHWNKLGEGIKAAWDAVANWFKTYVAPIFTKAWWAEKWNSLVAATSEKLAELKAKIDEKMAPIKQWFETYIKPVFTKDYWITLWNNIKTAASEKLAEIKTKIDEKMAPIRKWFNDKIKPVFTKSYWVDKWNAIKNAAADKLTEIKNKFDEKMKPLKDWFENKLKPIFSKKYWTDMLAGMKDGLKDGLNKCLENIEKFINNIAKKLGLGKVQEALSAIGIDFNLSEIKIPRLATGGIATSSILANIGEAGREAVLPLDRNTEWMDILADRINGRSAPSKIVLMVDGRELGYAAINSINGITKQTGTLQLQLV